MAFAHSAFSFHDRSTPAYWFIFHENRILVDVRTGVPELPLLHSIENISLEPVSVSHLGCIGNIDCYAVESAKITGTPGKMEYSELRPLFSLLPDKHFSMAGKAFQIIEWDRRYRFCSRCGANLFKKTDVRAKECPACGIVSYPPVTPAIIVAVIRDGKILLAHSHRFKCAFYSVLAGFVEPGETLEECVHREVREEVGIEIADIKYFGSLPWPFPNVLMTGFTARYESGEITIDMAELSDAAWYSPDDLPAIPGKGTIARQLIDWFTANHRPR
ncbi:MAG TPA: NAD(+) diphosphatase [Dissulfurispiraceae bacterium]|nr:NAD(+) diphosphatase [Dissulfurispiraceae bacterium]